MNEDDTAADDERKYNDDSTVGGETLEIISVPQGEIPPDLCSQPNSDIDSAEAEGTFQRSRLAAALVAVAKHCPPQLGWQAKTKRQHNSLEQENSPKIARKQRQLVGFGRPRQEEELLSWLTHALVPSDVHAQDKKITEEPCGSQVGEPSPKFVSHISVKRQTAHRISLSSIPEERWSYWLTRPLRRGGTSDASAQGDLQPPTSVPGHSRTPSIPATRFTSAYASCFASGQRQPSVIRWKRP